MEKNGVKMKQAHFLNALWKAAVCWLVTVFSIYFFSTIMRGEDVFFKQSGIIILGESVGGVMFYFFVFYLNRDNGKRSDDWS